MTLLESQPKQRLTARSEIGVLFPLLLKEEHRPVEAVRRSRENLEYRRTSTLGTGFFSISLHELGERQNCFLDGSDLRRGRLLVQRHPLSNAERLFSYKIGRNMTENSS